MPTAMTTMRSAAPTTSSRARRNISPAARTATFSTRPPKPAATAASAVSANTCSTIRAPGSKGIDLFDHVVRARQQRRRQLDTERFGGLQVDEEFEFGREFDRQIGRLLAF